MRPHLEYAAPVWDPYCSSHVDILEKVQKFALRISYKAWKEQYTSLLERSGLQPLAIQRKPMKLCYLYHLIQGDITFSKAPIIPRNLEPRLRNFYPQLLCQPYCTSTSYMFSFFPHVIALWNALPSALHCVDTFSEFKCNVLSFLQADCVVLV